METLVNTYKLNQGNNQYILSIFTVGENIRIKCQKEFDVNVQKFSKDYTLEDLQNLDPTLKSVNTTSEVLDFLDRALKIQKVRVTEEGDLIKINFYIESQEIGIGEGKEMQYTTFDQTVNEYTNYNINQNIPLELNYETGNNEYIEGIDSSNNQYITGTEDISAQYAMGTQDYSSQNNEGTTAEYTTTQYETGFDLNNYTTPAIDNNEYLNTFQTNTETVETTNQYYQPEQTFDSQPYITPVEEEPFTAEYTQPTGFETTNIYEQTTTTTNTQSIQDDRISKLIGDTDSLKNDHQLIQYKLNELSGEMDNYKNQLNLLTEQNEVNMLRAENKAIKDQLAELESLKQKANEIDFLKRKLNELEQIKLQYEKEIKSLRESSEAKKIRSSEGMESKRLLFEGRSQQICVKGDIIHNTEELELLTRKINKNNKKLTINLIYKATADSDKAAAFHAKCDDAKSTLVLVETDKGKRFGGFTACSWAGECIDKKDKDAFVFSLDKMETYDNIAGEDAIGCYPKFGPIFLGCQIRIYDNAFTKGGTTFEKGLNFNTEEDYELTGGDRNFNVSEIEVYEVIA